MKNDSSPVRRGFGVMFDGLGRGAFIVAGLVLSAMTVLIVSESLARTFIGVSMGFVHELTGYGVVALTLIGGAASFRRGGFFSVTFIYERLAARLRWIVRLLHILLSFVFCGALFYYCLMLVIGSHATGNRASTILATPLYIPQILMPVGFALLVVFLIEALWRGEDRVPEATRAEEETGVLDTPGADQIPSEARRP